MPESPIAIQGSVPCPHGCPGRLEAHDRRESHPRLRVDGPLPGHPVRCHNHGMRFPCAEDQARHRAHVYPNSAGEATFYGGSHEFPQYGVRLLKARFRFHFLVTGNVRSGILLDILEGEDKCKSQ